MKKNITLLLAILSSAICLGQNNTPDTPICLVKQINIGTGVDHLSASSLYGYSQADTTVKDRYWRLTMLPENTILSTPSCAQTLDSMDVALDVWWDWIDLSTSTESRAISYIYRPTTEGLYPNEDEFWGVYKWPPDYVDSPARFTRTFKIVADEPQLITFSMEGKADDIVFIRVDAEPGVAIFDDEDHPNNLRYDNMTNTSATPFTIEKTLLLEPGIHTVDMDLYDAGGICSGLNVKGNISCENEVIVDNICFGYTDVETCSIITDSSSVTPPDTTTSITNRAKELSKMQLYPNPATNKIYLKTTYTGDYRINIFNCLGQAAATLNGYTGGLVEIDTKGLPAGNYFIELVTNKGILISRFDKL